MPWLILVQVLVAFYTNKGNGSDSKILFTAEIHQAGPFQFLSWVNVQQYALG